MADKEPKPVTLVTVDPFKHAGTHYAVGDIVPNVEADLALELTGAGRTRLATDDDIAAAKARAAAEAKAAKAKAADGAAS